MTSANGPEQRLPRLLAMVPYFLARPGIATAEAAEDFGISEQQLIKDLDLLWMCGLPGHGPGDLIDLSYEGGTVTIIDDQGLRKPLRLTADEALALVVALRTLAETQGATDGVTDTAAVQRALAKVESAAGGVDDQAMAVALDQGSRVAPLLERAVAEGRALQLRYYTAARDETTERVVDPLRVFTTDGHTYLEAWCRQAEGVRVFRADRVDEARLLDEPARPPEGIELRDVGDGVFQPAPEHLLVELRLAPAYAWVADYYPVESARELDGEPGAVQVALRVSEPTWVRSLVLGSAGQVSVLAPDWLAESIRTDAVRALAAYS